jgi:hypothetical protein
MKEFSIRGNGNPGISADSDSIGSEVRSLPPGVYMLEVLGDDEEDEETSALIAETPEDQSGFKPCPHVQDPSAGTVCTCVEDAEDEVESAAAHQANKDKIKAFAAARRASLAALDGEIAATGVLTRSPVTRFAEVLGDMHSGAQKLTRAQQDAELASLFGAGPAAKR